METQTIIAFGLIPAGFPLGIIGMALYLRLRPLRWFSNQRGGGRNGTAD